MVRLMYVLSNLLHSILSSFSVLFCSKSVDLFRLDFLLLLLNEVTEIGGAGVLMSSWALEEFL